MIYTSSYKDCKTNKYKTYSISKDKGHDASYYGDCYLKLAPLESFFRVWRNNTGKISENENTAYYIKEFYHQVLEKLDPEEIYNEVDNSILLCYENNEQFCHRHLVAAWLELFLDIEVFEVKVDDLKISIVDKPDYIKKELEKVILSSVDLGEYKSINEMYLALKNNGNKVLKK